MDAVTGEPPPEDSPSEDELLAAARAGNEDAFKALVGPYLRELHVHCYRMLGSVQDAEDVMQEVLLRAWRHMDAFEGRSSVRGWLYRIATNRCLTSRSRARTWPPLEQPQGPPLSNADDVEVVALEPYPDALLDLLDDRNDPSARYELRESVQLAFLATIQLLPARQRAVLLLRDVLGYSAAETGAFLEASVASVNSALQRARATLERHRASGRLHSGGPPPTRALQSTLIERFTAAWQAGDVNGLVTLLSHDALLTMPPYPMAYRGRPAIASFLATVPAGGDLTRITLVPTRANGQPALAAYGRDPSGTKASAYGIMVLTVDDDAIAEITGFTDPSLFALFGLPDHLPDVLEA
ncbi:RNA polymerase subunit sigma-70 [Streptomyces sp. NBC_01481]|uniref:RNA polymerase subunit sigma-70 n=1 Tax=Streptomyces sp. NBC_01481 TaxID=2975869 RepID=UPI00225A9622|nr:RNA polymerase subunit sigma-70 [Streptomyces sp. NBC_01481]MCX4582387.1 RNA polymerase subunit sigma-70 [Streptomyces sp. NBC_01481]